MLQLALRIVEATGGSQGRQKGPQRGKLWDLLGRLLKTMEVAQGNQPPFHGTVEGFGTEAITTNHKLRSSMFHGRPRELNGYLQLHWE
eukprot:2689200-Heterocapsa_arctica.AAC.1